jgi:hypothetical protein
MGPVVMRYFHLYTLEENLAELTAQRMKNLSICMLYTLFSHLAAWGNTLEVC